MKRKSFILIVGFLTTASVVLCDFSSYAEENIGELKKQIEILQKRVEELESNQNQQQDNNASEYFNNRSNKSWDPFAEMDRIQEEMNRMFQNSYNRRGNRDKDMFSDTMSFDYDMDVKETKDGYEIRFDMTGLDKEKIDIQIDEYSITIKGEHSKEDTRENSHQYFSSRSFGSFMKTIPLPVDADTSKVKTEKEGGSLVIRIPKKTS